MGSTFKVQGRGEMKIERLESKITIKGGKQSALTFRIHTPSRETRASYQRDHRIASGAKR